MLNRLACLRGMRGGFLWTTAGIGRSVESVLSAFFARAFHEDFLDRRIKAQTEDNPFKEPDARELSEDLGREMARREVKKKKALIEKKYGFKQKGAPPRLLTWDAIEHIYFLRSEYPKEWSLQRLAEGFGVDVDVIIRVLKSKYRPVSEEKRAFHDQQALTNRRQLGLPYIPPIRPEQRKQKALPPRLKVKALPQTEVKMLSPVQQEMVDYLGEMKQRLQQGRQTAITASRTERNEIVEIQNHDAHCLEDIAKGTWRPQQNTKDSTRKGSQQTVTVGEESMGNEYKEMVDIDFDLMQESFEDMPEKYPDVDDEEAVEKDGQFFTKDGDFLYKV